MDTLGANLYRAARQAPKANGSKAWAESLMANFPFSVLTLLTYGYLGFHLIDGAGKLMGAPVEWNFSTLGWEKPRQRLDGGSDRAVLSAFLLSELHQFQHALLRERPLPDSTDPSAQRLVFHAIPVVLLQFRQHTWNTPFRGG